eukprot:2343389-Pyramimonas_sp.AAC.1
MAASIRWFYPTELKAALYTQEPLTFKQGILRGLPKNTDLMDWANFRNICLDNTISKHYHKRFRNAAAQTIHVMLRETQVGGRPRRGASMA